MGYIGVQPAKGQYRKLTDISSGFNGSATSFQLSVPPGGVNYYIIPSSPQQLMVSVGGIIQNPGVDYTTTGSQIIFTTAPAAGLSFFGTFLGDVGNGVSASGVDYIATGTGAVTRTTASKLGDVVSVKDFGASTAATATQNAAAINAAVQANLSGEIQITEAYSINSSINLNGFSGTIRFLGRQAKLSAAVNNLKFFTSTTNAYGCKIIDANLEGTGFTGVYGFDLVKFQLRGSQLVRPVMVNCEYGIYLRSLCWGLKIEQPETNNVTYPITLVEGCNAVLIDHPSIDTFGTVGIWIKTGGAYPNVGNMLLNGYIQNGSEGVVDQGIQTQIVGTYFEGCTASDIALKTDSAYFYGCATNHTSTGNRAYRGLSADAAMVVHPYMSNAARTIGLFDFDGTNTNCYYDLVFGAGSRNLPLGVTTGINTISNKPGPIGGVTPDAGTFSLLTANGKASLVGGTSSSNGMITALAPGVAQTLFTMSGASRGRYEITAMIANSGAAALYTVFATAIFDGNGQRMVANNTANMTLTLSGADVQVTQTSGGAQTIFWSQLYITIV